MRDTLTTDVLNRAKGAGMLHKQHKGCSRRAHAQRLAASLPVATSAGCQMPRSMSAVTPYREKKRVSHCCLRTHEKAPP